MTWQAVAVIGIAGFAVVGVAWADAWEKRGKRSSEPQAYVPFEPGCPPGCTKPCCTPSDKTRAALDSLDRTTEGGPF